MRAVSNPPNPWLSTHVEWLEEPPEAALEVFEEDAKSILSENDSPDLGFRWSVNPYRGCFHSCAYCVGGDTTVLLANGRTRAIRDVRAGEEIIGTEVRGRYRRYVRTKVIVQWATVKPAYRVTLADGTELITSGDHRFLSERGWKHVADVPGPVRPHLTTSNRLFGFGALATTPAATDEYRRGYLCGMIRGDGTIGTYAAGKIHVFRIALTDLEALRRARGYLEAFQVPTFERAFQVAAGYRPMRQIRTNQRTMVERVRDVIAWPDAENREWQRGFLAGIFDAEGSSSRGILRISNTSPVMVATVERALSRFGFDHIVEAQPQRDHQIFAVRVRGGIQEHLRFFLTVDPAITRKRDLSGFAVTHKLDLRVTKIEPLGLRLPMYDITTGTGDFIANGVISHNCYARPSHQYLGLGAGTDFDRKLVVKTNAAALLREAFMKKSWQGERIMFSGITDCYQPLEASYGITRACLEVCAEFANPVGVITKSMVIRRDVDLLARIPHARATLSIPFARDDVAKKIEPNASPPSRRFETLRMLSDAGVRTGIAIAPVIPGLNDPDIPELLERARAAGATSAFITMLRLPAEVLPVFQERIREVLAPERVRKIEHAVIELRRGKMNEARFGERFVGQGERWKAIESLFELHCRRLGFVDEPDDKDETQSTFRRPDKQLSLF